MASSSTKKSGEASGHHGSPRGWALPGLVGIFGIALAVYFAYNQTTTPKIQIDDYTARTDAVLRSTPLIDGHNDLPFLLRLELHNQIYNNKTFPFRESEWPAQQRKYSGHVLVTNTSYTVSRSGKPYRSRPDERRQGGRAILVRLYRM